MLTVGDSTGETTFHSGLMIQDLGFQDVSSGTNVVTGAIRLRNTEDFNLTNVHCRNIKGPSTTTGYCFLFDGGSSFTQFGVVVNPSVLSVRFPVQIASAASEINFYGGNLACSNASNAIGMDLGANFHTSMVSSGGEWGVFGTHIMNCATGISMYNTSNMNYYGIMEQTDDGMTGTGIVIDGDLPGKPEKSTIAGSINNFMTGVLLNNQARNNKITANISETSAPIVLGGSAQPFTLPSTLILTTANYAGSGGVAVGTQIPSDVTIPQETIPPAPVSGSRRLYVDGGTGNGSDLTVERPDGTVVDLEGGLLNYQAPKATMGTGTVYTFSVPSIPAGKGIRARVFWQCAACTLLISKTFSWQFGGTTTAYAAYIGNSTALAYTEVRIFNTAGHQDQNTMFGDAVTVGNAVALAGTVTSMTETTTGPKSLTFSYSSSSDTITPQGFIVEAIQ